MFDFISDLNAFRDISFNEAEHSYKYRDKVCTSVTTLIKEYETPFDTEGQAERYALKHGLNKSLVILEWEQKKITAANKGTELHKYAEMKFASKQYDFDEEDLPKKLTEIIDKFFDDSKDWLIPVKAEWIVGDYELGICGTMDKLFYNLKEKELQVWDYKTSKQISTYNPFKTTMTNGLEHLYQTDYNKFSLQTGVYKKIVHRNTQFKLGSSYICWVNEKNDTYKVFKMAELQDEVEYMLNRKMHLNEHLFSIFE
jgi:hypothetical protein